MYLKSELSLILKTGGNSIEYCEIVLVDAEGRGELGSILYGWTHQM
jgi:hypothetical protein